MKTPSHAKTILSAALALGAAFFCAVAHAEWPEKPIQFIVPFGPGGANDLMGRVAWSPTP